MTSPADRSFSFLQTVGDRGDHRDASVAAPRLGSDLDWRLTVDGDVENRLELSLDALWRLPVERTPVSIQCVSSGAIARDRLNQPLKIATEIPFVGVSLLQVIALAKPASTVQCVRFVSKAPGGTGPADEPHATAIDFDHCAAPGKVWLTGCMNGRPLPYRNGGPLRSVVHDLYFYKSVKWLERIEFVSRPLDECRGTWERYAGYHPRARRSENESFVPFFAVKNEQGVPVEYAGAAARREFDRLAALQDLSRLVVAQLPPRGSPPMPGADEIAQLIVQSKPTLVSPDDSQQAAALRGLRFKESCFAGVVLAGVNFSLSRFQQCDFSNADLRGCDFEGAKFHGGKLTNAQLQGACLAGVEFLRGADLSGAQLSGANLSGARFSPDVQLKGAKLHGAQGLSESAVAFLRCHGAIEVPDAVEAAPEAGGYLPFHQVEVQMPAEQADAVIGKTRELFAACQQQTPYERTLYRLVDGGRSTAQRRLWIWVPRLHEAAIETTLAPALREVADIRLIPSSDLAWLDVD